MIATRAAPSRRVVLAGAASLLLGAKSASAAPARDGLQAAAAAKGLAYGSAVPITRFREDARYRELLARECGLLTCDNAMKMTSAMPKPEGFSFEAADDTVAFATGNRQRMRGHCLVWHESLPPWARARITDGGAKEAERLMARYIAAIVGRYRGSIDAWDVVNEVVAADQGRGDGLRRTPWLDALGPRYLELAFGLAHDVDPSAAGVYNENDCEQDLPWMDERRTIVLRTLERLLKRKVPIRRLGLQAHLFSNVPFDQGKLRRFLAEVAGMGLAIEVTELDIDDRAFPADIATRDRGVADFGRRFLDVVLDEKALLAVTTWDLYDPDTWLNASPQRRRPDGLPQRALPFDEQYRRKPIWHAMKQAFTAAPDHSAARARLRAA